MALRPILNEKDPLLHKPSRPIDNIDARILTLLDDLVETLRHANGVGLAAPQVGVLRRAVVIDNEGEMLELINPEIIFRSQETLTEPEGCLSSPGEYGMVERPQMVTARYLDRSGTEQLLKGEGLLARAICHEVDHLDGRLFKELAERMLTPEELEAE